MMNIFPVLLIKGQFLIQNHQIYKSDWIFQKKTQRPLTLGSDKAWIEKVREMKEVLLYNEEINRSIMKKVNFEHEDFQFEIETIEFFSIFITLN